MKALALFVLISALVDTSLGQYGNLNCGECGPGKVRQPTNGLYCGACVDVTTSCAPGYIESGNGCSQCPCGNQDPMRIRTQGCRRDGSGNVICDCNPNYSGTNCQHCAPGCLQRDYFPYDCYKPGETVTCYGANCNSDPGLPPPPPAGPITVNLGCPGGNCNQPMVNPLPPPPSPCQDNACGSQNQCPGNNCGGNQGCPGNSCQAQLPNQCQDSQSVRCRLPQPSLCPGCNCVGANCPCDTCQFNQNHYSTAIQVAGTCPPCQHQHTACPPCNAQCPSCPLTTTNCPSSTCGSPCQAAANCQCPPPCPSCCNQCGVVAPVDYTYITHNNTIVLPTNIYNTTIIYKNEYYYYNCSNQGTTPTPGLIVSLKPNTAQPEPKPKTTCEVCCDPRGTYDFEKCVNGKCECSCKANVIGAQCDHCRPGYFGLMKKNRDGCIACFCSGVSLECTEAFFYRDNIELDFPTHRLEVTDRTFSYVEGISETSGKVTLNYIGTYKGLEVLYWVLPSQFTGNRLTSYGGKILLTRSFTTDDNSRSVLGNDIIIIGAYGSSIYWASPETHSSRSSSKLKVPLNDKAGWLSFRHGATRVATRSEIMEVLADVQKILIRASMGNPPVMASASLSNVQLSTASPKRPPGSAPEITSLVEDCVCPTGYQGWSCESCSPGYYRDNTDTSQGIFGTCKRCPCGNHADGCSLKNGKVYCHCKEGYSGLDCTSCEPLTMTMDPISCRDCVNELVIFNCSYGGGSQQYHIEMTTEPMWSFLSTDMATSNPGVEFPGKQNGNSRTISIPLFSRLKSVDCKLKDMRSGAVVMNAHATVKSENCEQTTQPAGPNVFLNVSSEFECIFENETASFTCGTNYASGSKISWVREDSTSLPDSARAPGSTLKFLNPTPSDSGAYVCVLEGGSLNTIYTRTVVLKVKECVATGSGYGGVTKPPPPTGGEFSEESDELGDSENPKEEGSIEIQEPPPDEGNKGGGTGNDEDDFDVYAQDIDPNDAPLEPASSAPVIPLIEAGDYSTSSTDIPKEIIAPTDIKVTPPVQTVAAGQPAEIKCVADGDDVRIMWRAESESKDAVISSEGGLLKFSAVKESDEGLYVCIAYNTAGKATVKATIIVEPANFKLTISTDSKPDEYDVGTQIILNCEGSETVYKIKWFREGSDMPVASQQYNNGSLVIKNLQPADLGVYVCSAVSIGGQSADARVEVKVREAMPYTAPVVRMSQKSPFRVAPGQSFRIHCHAKGNPSPVITWSRRILSEKDGPYEETIRETDYSKDSYEFLYIQQADEGHYTCTAQNAAGEDHKTLLILVDETVVKECEEAEFRCRNGEQCIPKTQRCNGIRDCSDGSDENHSACVRWKKSQN